MEPSTFYANIACIEACNIPGHFFMSSLPDTLSA
jgi:hypothetical protein